MSMPVTTELIREVTDFNTKVAGGIEKLSSITDDQFFFSYLVWTLSRNFTPSLGTWLCFTTCTA